MPVCPACARTIQIPKGKEVEAIYYTDGTVDIPVDIPLNLMGAIYMYAHQLGCSPEEAASKMVEKGLEIMSENDPKLKKKLKKKRKKNVK